MQPNNKVRNDPLDVDYDPHAARLQQQQQQQQIQRRRDRPIPPPPPAAPSVRPNLTSQPELQQQIPHKQQEEKQQDKHSEQVQQIKDSAALIYSAWTAHVNPSGTPYYFNSVTNQSVWERPACLPLAEFPTASHKNFTQELQSETGIIGLQDISEQSDKQPQEEIILHERAIAMKKLPNTMWAIVLTSRDHEYFINLTTHEAAWEMPDDIAELVGQIMAGAGYDTDENEIVEDDGEEVNDNSHPLSSQINQYDELQDEKEVVRVYESSSASLAEMEAHVRQQELEHGFEKKHGVGNSSKRHADQMQQNGSQSDSKKKSKKVESEGELTNAEKQAMFMDMLEEVETNPFSTWEKELDQFTDDPRYVQIPTAKLRKNYFETYCKNKAAQIHKQRSANEIKTPKETFRAFLDDVLGTADWRKLGSLSAYDDFSRKWKRDPRFTVISDDRDRKAMFKEFVTRMKAAEGERKRAEKQQIQDNFFELLRSVEGINNESRWRDVQRKIDRDKRYNVIPTPIQREDLFREFLKISALEKASSEAERKEIERKAREVESLRQREETVRKQKTNLAREVRKSQFIMKSSESVDLLKNLLVDLIKSHKTTLKDSVTYLATDARFDQIMLSEHELEELFKEHTTNIFKKRLTAWHNFINEITLIITPFEDVSEILLKDPRTSRLECTSEDELARLYKEYQTEREQKARSELEVCLKENGFVRFHVKSAVGNCHVEAVEKGLKEAEPGAEWRLIGLDEVKSVLQEDKRYNDFECFPAERDRIVFSFMKQLIEECRGEKGGVLDSIVARNAGGHVERK